MKVFVQPAVIKTNLPPISIPVVQEYDLFVRKSKYISLPFLLYFKFSHSLLAVKFTQAYKENEINCDNMVITLKI